METKQASLTETLTEESIKKVGEKIAGLPTGDEFTQKVEDDLWQKLVGDDNLEDDESVEWDDLPDKSKSVIGYVDEEGAEVPWWLESFEWQVESRGETIDNLGENLSDLPNFDQTATKIYKPELADDNITNVLNSFSELGGTIDENLGIEREQGYPFPSDVFEITGETVRTTEGFRDWFESLLGLCPPFNEALTSLVMVNSNVKVEAVEGVVPDELLATLEDIGVIDESSERIYESGYHEPIATILTNMGGLLDRTLPSDVDSLELLFYRTWAENYRGNKERVSEYIEMASKSEPSTLEIGESNFGSMSFNIPLRLTFYNIQEYNSDSHPRIIYTTGGMNTDGSYPSNSWRKISSIMRSADLLKE